MSSNLEPPFRYPDGLEERASLAELTDVLSRLAIDCDDVAEFIRFADWH
jgi:hypothetical protein